MYVGTLVNTESLVYNPKMGSCGYFLHCTMNEVTVIVPHSVSASICMIICWLVVIIFIVLMFLRN